MPPSRSTLHWKLGLVRAMLASYLTLLFTPPLREFFLLEIPTIEIWLAVVAAVALAAAVLEADRRLIAWWDGGDGH
jgi:hypothetical protein